MSSNLSSSNVSDDCDSSMVEVANIEAASDAIDNIIISNDSMGNDASHTTCDSDTHSGGHSESADSTGLATTNVSGVETGRYDHIINTIVFKDLDYVGSAAAILSADSQKIPLPRVVDYARVAEVASGASIVGRPTLTVWIIDDSNDFVPHLQSFVDRGFGKVYFYNYCACDLVPSVESSKDMASPSYNTSVVTIINSHLDFVNTFPVKTKSPLPEYLLHKIMMSRAPKFSQIKKYYNADITDEEVAREVDNSRYLIRGIIDEFNDFSVGLEKISTAWNGFDVEAELTMQGKVTIKREAEIYNLIASARVKHGHEVTVATDNSSKYNCLAVYSADLVEDVVRVMQKHLAENNKYVDEIEKINRQVASDRTGVLAKPDDAEEFMQSRINFGIVYCSMKGMSKDGPVNGYYFNVVFPTISTDGAETSMAADLIPSDAAQKIRDKMFDSLLARVSGVSVKRVSGELYCGWADSNNMRKLLTYL